MPVYPARPFPGGESSSEEQNLWYLERVSHLVRLATGDPVSETWVKHQKTDLRDHPWTHIVSWWKDSTNTPLQIQCIQGTVLGKCAVTWDNGAVSMTVDPGMPDQEFLRRVRSITEMLETATWI